MMRSVRSHAYARLARRLSWQVACGKGRPSSPPPPETVRSEDLNRRRQLVNLAVAFSQSALSPFNGRSSPALDRPRGNLDLDCRGARCRRSTLTFTLHWKRRIAAAELRRDQEANFARSLPMDSEHKFEHEAVPKRNKAGGLDRSAYEQLVQSVVDYAIFMLDPKGHVSSWNPGAERIKGYTAEEIIGEHFSRFYTPEDRDAGLPEHVLKQAAEEGRFVAEGWRVRKDGSHFWAAVVVDPIRQGDKLVGFAKVTRDMTESREANLAALESERRFRLLVQGGIDYAIYMLDPQGHITSEARLRAILESAIDYAIITLDCDGLITGWSPGAERLLLWTAAEAVGQSGAIIFTPEDQAAAVPERERARAERDGRAPDERWHVRRDGSRFFATG